MSVTIVFNGMCAIDHESDGRPATIYLPTEGGAHAAALIAPTKDVIDVAATKWLPAYLGYVQSRAGALVQVGVWPLAQERLVLGASGGVTWSKRNEALDLRKKEYHEKAKAMAREEIEKIDPTMTIFDVKEGTFAATKLVNGSVHRKGGAKIEDRAYAKEIQWTGPDGQLTLKNKNGKELVIKDGAGMTVSNLAAVPHDEGLKHFSEYYKFIILNGEQEILIVDKDAEVYDCVPPTAFP